MKKTIVYLFVCLILTASAMTSCKAKIKYSFLNPITNICAIKIVEVGADDSQGINEQTEIMVIEDIKAFIDDFTQLSCFKVYTDPLGVAPFEIAIKIIYSNDDYELISSNGQARYTKKKYKNYVGYYYFNDDEFDELIDKYLSLGKS